MQGKRYKKGKEKREKLRDTTRQKKVINKKREERKEGKVKKGEDRQGKRQR